MRSYWLHWNLCTYCKYELLSTYSFTHYSFCIRVITYINWMSIVFFYLVFSMRRFIWSNFFTWCSQWGDLYGATQGFEKGHNLVCLLKKSFYTLKQASIVWYKKIDWLLVLVSSIMNLIVVFIFCKWWYLHVGEWIINLQVIILTCWWLNHKLK